MPDSSTTPPPLPPRAPIAPPPPQVVHVVAKSGGLWRATTFIIGLILFALVFLVGFGTGAVTSSMAEMQSGLHTSTYRDGSSAKIAVIPIEGAIDQAMALYVHAAVDRVLDDRAVRGVIIRVDSPGGGVTASDQIWADVNRLKQKLPVVASFGGIAASGGYYISCGADTIMAEETCITGSIGVIAQVLTFGGALDKLGIEPVTLVASGSPNKDVANDTYRAWDDADRQQMRVILDAAYSTFRDRVRTGRGEVIGDEDVLASIADGSVYTAAQAKDNGLVDTIGYFDDAIAETERRAGITVGRATVERIERPLAGLSDLLFARRLPPAGLEALDAEKIRRLVNDLGAPRLMYLMQ